jgi:hypothetical protein
MKKIIMVTIMLLLSKITFADELTEDVKYVLKEKTIINTLRNRQHVCLLGIVNLKTKLLSVEGKLKSEYSYTTLYNPKTLETLKCKEHNKVVDYMISELKNTKPYQVVKMQTLEKNTAHVCYFGTIYHRSLNDSTGLFNNEASYFYNSVYDIRTNKPLICSKYRDYILYLVEIKDRIF